MLQIFSLALAQLCFNIRKLLTEDSKFILIRLHVEFTGVAIEEGDL